MLSMSMEIWKWTKLFCFLLGLWNVKRCQVASCGKGHKECPGQGWEGEFWNVEPRLVSRDRCGERYEVGKEGNVLRILYLYGSPFELGRAHGILLREEIQNMYFNLFTYMEDEWISALHLTLLPDTVARRIARLALNAALDATYLLTLKYIPARFVDEMLGLSQGAMVDFQDVVRIQMVPELFQASCSMLGSWGPATRLSSRGGLIQMRALDWEIISPIVDFHTVFYVFPSDGNSFALFSWAGFIGCISGYSGQLGVSEKSWVGSQATGSHRGMPWPFMLRDVLQFTYNVEDAWTLFMTTTRTCPILVGVGSQEDSKFVLLGSASDVLELLDDSNFTTVTSITPPPNQFKGVIFVDKYHQPSDDPCMRSVVARHYGQLDIPTLMDMVALQQSGEMHVALYDFTGDNVYFSWAVRDPTTGNIVPAYKRNFLKLNMSELFIPKPSCSASGKGLHCSNTNGRISLAEL